MRRSTVDRSVICTSEDGLEKSSTRTTAQAQACIEVGWPPKIEAWALLRLAQWCEERPASQQGSHPCPTNPVSACPPVSIGVATPAEATLAAVDPDPAAAPVPSVESAHRPTSPVRQPEGGV